jgi:hypothetical protein
MVVHERLRLAREARHEDIEAIAQRSGIREHVLRTLEDGRYGDLPSGIYGRTAVKAYAAAVGLPADEMLAACVHLLPRGEDPLAGMARVRGFKTRAEPARDETPVEPAHREHDSPDTTLSRFLFAACVDACSIVALLALLVGITIAVTAAQPGALGRAAPYAFGVVSAILGSCYFVVFAGVRGLTLGEAAAGIPPRAEARVGLDQMIDRAWRAATRDLWGIRHAGAVVAISAGDRSSESRHGTPRAEQPARS